MRKTKKLFSNVFPKHYNFEVSETTHVFATGSESREESRKARLIFMRENFGLDAYKQHPSGTDLGLRATSGFSIVFARIYIYSPRLTLDRNIDATKWIHLRIKLATPNFAITHLALAMTQVFQSICPVLAWGEVQVGRASNRFRRSFGECHGEKKCFLDYNGSRPVMLLFTEIAGAGITALRINHNRSGLAFFMVGNLRKHS